MRLKFLFIFVLVAGCSPLDSDAQTRISQSSIAEQVSQRAPTARKEMTVCVVDKALKKNPTYYGMATTQTRLSCEISGGDKIRPTLQQMYAIGWRIIDIVGEGWINFNSGEAARAPIYYLERSESDFGKRLKTKPQSADNKPSKKTTPARNNETKK